MITLKNWKMFQDYSDAQHKKLTYVHGVVYGHPEFKDGTEIVTSEVMDAKYDEQSNSLVLVTHTKNEYVVDMSDAVEARKKYVSKYMKDFGICM